MTPIQKRILAVLILGTLMSAVDVTIVLLAIPQITNTLHTDLATSIWIIISYLLVVAICTTQFGRLGDIYGRGRMFNLGFIVFTVGSALCGLSPTIYVLIASRVIQGLGGSLLQANSGAIIADTFERHHRGKAYGYTGMGWNIGSTLGIVLGGVLTTFAGWPYIFYINVPIGIVAVWYGLKHIKTAEKKSESLDMRGMLVLGAMLLLITLSATEIVSIGVSATDLATLVIGFLLFPLFLFIERRSKFPTINLAAFRNRILSHSILASFFQSLGYLSVLFILIMYLQGVRGLDPFNASLYLLPGYVLSGFTAPYMGRLSDRFGSRSITTIGLLLITAAIMIYLFLTPTTSLYLIVLATIISGVGAAMFFPANSSAVMANAPEHNFGAASGLLRTLSNIGTLGSYILTITIASLAVTRDVAFKVFLGTSDLTGNVSAAFLTGMHAVFTASIVILIIAILLSASKGREERHAPLQHEAPARHGRKSR